MAFIQPPSTFNAGSRLYFKRLYNSIVEEINKATSLPVVNKMPINPKQGAYYFQNAIAGDPTITKQGTYVWNGSGWVGNMDEQQWSNNRIASVAVDKLLAGTIGAQEIILADSAQSIIRSSNYVAGSSGWAIKGNGVAEFQDVTVRGTLNADDILYGTLAEGRIGDNTIGAGPVKTGAVHRAYGGVSGPNSINYDPAQLSNPSNPVYVTLPVTANSNRTAVLLISSLMPRETGSQDGFLVTGVGKGALNQTNLLYKGRGVGRYTVGNNATLTLTYYDTSPGTAAVTYWWSFHHNMKPSGGLYCDWSLSLLEISK
jgi:hypothetical protein